MPIAEALIIKGFGKKKFSRCTETNITCTLSNVRSNCIGRKS